LTVQIGAFPFFGGASMLTPGLNCGDLLEASVASTEVVNREGCFWTSFKASHRFFRRHSQVV
jgi:hypothetical protein